MPWPKASWATCGALCVLANACSLELPSTGPELSPTRGAVGVPEPGTTVIEKGQDAGLADAQAGAMATIERDAGAVSSTGVPIDAALDASESDAGAVRPARCVLDGRYALRVAFDVTWVGTEFASIVPIIDRGDGELSFTVLMELSTNGDTLSSQMRTCSSDVPEFVATLSRERYQAQFAEAVWDAPGMPTFAAPLRTECGKPGCALRGEVFHALIGAALPSPDAAWPREASAGSWPDHDGDGAEGIAVTMLGPERGQSSYAYPPLDLLSFRRVQSLGLGLRVSVGLDGVLESCDGFKGDTVDGRVETRAVNCRAQATSVQNTSSACEANELRFLNENLPVWSVSEGRFEAKRLAADADCKAVRKAFR